MTGFAALNSRERRSVRLFRLHLYRLHLQKKFLPENNVSQMQQIGIKFFSHEKFKELTEEKKKDLIDIAIFDEPGNDAPLVWGHEFAKHYPPVDKPVEVLAILASRLPIEYLSLFLDTLDLLSPKLQEQIENQLLDVDAILQLPVKRFQGLLRAVDTKVISDSFKILPAEVQNQMLANLSRRNRDVVNADLAHQETVSEYKGKLAVYSLVREYFRMVEDGSFKKLD